MADKYFVVDCISGVKSGKGSDLEAARAKRDKLNEKRKAEGGSDDFWLIIDSKGNEVE